MTVEGQRQAGRAMLVFGAIIATPLDEAAVTAISGGTLALPAAVVQGPATVLAGLGTMALGGILIATAKGKR